jgi:predicted tellurium resistance membrane protein TerC
MIGMTLIAEGFHFHVEKGYVYAAMAFSAFIELLNMLGRRRRVRKDSLRARPSLSIQSRSPVHGGGEQL